VFSVADSLTPEEVKALAWLENKAQQHVRTGLQKMRGSVQASLQRMATRALRDAATKTAGWFFEARDCSGLVLLLKPGFSLLTLW
jgi:hypothetical protein